MDPSVLNALWPQHPLTVTIVVCVVVPVVMHLAGFRLQWRKERREQEDSVANLMKRLADAQGAELSRLMTEGEILRSQVEILSGGCYRLQECLDSIREQLIAAAC